MAKRRPVTAEDLYEFQTISDPQISPDGSQIIFVVQRVDRKSEKKYTNLWLVPRGRGEARQFASDSREILGSHPESRHPPALNKHA